MKTDKAKLIQLIHIGKQQLNMDDFSYRALLQQLTNKNSTTKCTVVELHKILHELQTKGAKVKFFAKKAKNLTAYSPASHEAIVKSDITHKIRAVWITMGKQGFLKDTSEQALNVYARKLFNKNRSTLILNVAALEKEEASKLLEILKKWHMRVMRQALESKGIKLHPKLSYNELAEGYDEAM